MAFNIAPGSQRLTGDSAVGPSGTPIRLHSIHMVSDATAATVTLRNGTSTSGAAYLQVDGLSSDGVTINISGGLRFPNGLFLDDDGNMNWAMCVFSTEA